MAKLTAERLKPGMVVYLEPELYEPDDDIDPDAAVVIRVRGELAYVHLDATPVRVDKDPRLIHFYIIHDTPLYATPREAVRGAVESESQYIADCEKVLASLRRWLEENPGDV